MQLDTNRCFYTPDRIDIDNFSISEVEMTSNEQTVNFEELTYFNETDVDKPEPITSFI